MSGRVPAASQTRRPPGGPLTWHSKPSRPWWFSAPSPGAARPRCPCRPGLRSAGLPWLQRRRPVTRSLARCRVSATRTHSRFNRAPRAASPERPRLRTVPPGAPPPTRQVNPVSAIAQLPESKEAGPEKTYGERTHELARPLGWK